MTEIITRAQANHIMLAVLVLAPVLGLIWGAIAKRLVPGLLAGLAVGVGNFVLWTVYNAITDRLGLDTVKNLVVNLVLFIVVGAAAGFGIGWLSRRSAPKENSLPE